MKVNILLEKSKSLHNDQAKEVDNLKKKII